MFKIAEKTELNQISLTGVRAIVLAGLLIVKPRSLEEIRNAFIELNIMDKDNSDDILRIDLNTLKIMGFEISRASAKTNYKYVLGSHPFAFKISANEINILRKVYKSLKNNLDVASLLEFDSLFAKIASRVCDDEKKEILLGISSLKSFDKQLMRELLIDCSQSRTLHLVYRKPTAQTEEVRDVVAQRLTFENDKVYLYAYDLNKKDTVVLHLNRIKSIISRDLAKVEVEPTVTRVRFKLETSRLAHLKESEQILDSDDKYYLIEGNYYNDFIATQRMLSFGSKCIVVEPLEFKNNIVKKLKEMRKLYGN